MTRDTAGSPERRRPGRPPKYQAKIGVSFRFKPTLLILLREMAKQQGRNVTDQAEFLIEHAARELGSKLYDLQPAPIEDLYDRLARLEAEVAQLRSVIEKGLNDVASVFTAAAMPAAAENAAAAPEPIPAASAEPIKHIEYFVGDTIAIPGKPGEVARLLAPKYGMGLSADDNVVFVLPDGTVMKTGLSADQVVQVLAEMDADLSTHQMLQVIAEVDAEKSSRGERDQPASIEPKRKSRRS